jgi:membrane-associated phospholipid phosphatase
LFQTEINIALQSASSPPLTWLLSGVTYLGFMPAYVILLVTLAFALRLRPSLAVVGGVLLTGLVTEAAKDSVAFPRPDEVDSRGVAIWAARPLALVERGGATSFWGLPDPAAVEAVRQRATGNYGFPSGHVSAAASFLLCSAWFFRSRRVLAFALAWVPLMALSRVYLGRHFLADVLGGFAIGLFVSALSIVLFRALEPVDPAWPERRAMRPLWLLCLALVAATPFVPVLDARYVGALVGLAFSYALVRATGAPPDGGSTRQRALRILVGLSLFAATFLATEGLVRLCGRGRAAAMLATAIVTTATLAGTVAAGRRLRLYDPAP